MSVTYSVLCPAKINLFLAVGPIDRRGYHPLRTIFQTIDLFDELEVQLSDSDSFTCDHESVPADNTVTKARRLLREIMPLPPVAIRLKKRIPSEAGLGGGSSDAAGLIRIASAMVGNPPSTAELLSVASAIGADVPFFLVGGRAKGEGYGEKLEAIETPVNHELVLIKPTVGCSTGVMYRSLDELDYSWKEFSDEDILYNDFERVAPAECAYLRKVLKELGAYDSGLTGSGSVIFGRFLDGASAHRAIESLRQKNLVETFFCTYLNAMPSVVTR